MDFEHFLREANTKPDYNTNAGSYYKDLARKQELIKLLAKRIWEYDELLDKSLEEISLRLEKYIQDNDTLMSERLKNWDDRINNLDEEVTHIFLEWLNDGTLEEIIQDTIRVQFKQKTASIGQSDFNAMFENKNFDTVGIVKRTATQIEIFAQNNDKGVRYLLLKDPNDEFFKLGSGGFYKNHKIGAITTQGTGWIKTTDNWYTTQIGDSFTIDYEGSGIDLNFLSDARGGIWSIEIDNQLKEISTFQAVSNTTKKTELRHPYGVKKLTATFKGKHPLSTSEDVRGWIRESATIVGTKERTEIAELLHPNSNKEFAFNIKYGDDNALWHPEHNSLGSMFSHSFIVSIDNTQINFDNLVLNQVVTGKKVSVQQNVSGYNISGQIELAKYVIQHNLNVNGAIDYYGSLQAVQPFTLVTGYPLMLATNSSALNRVVTSFGHSKLNENDESMYYFDEEEGEAKGVLFTTNISGFGRYVAYAVLNQPTKTMRYDQLDSPEPKRKTFFWQRPTAPKFYFQAFENKQFTQGESYTWSGKIGVFEQSSLSNFLV